MNPLTRIHSLLIKPANPIMRETPNPSRRGEAPPAELSLSMFISIAMFKLICAGERLIDACQRRQTSDDRGAATLEA